MEEPVEPRENFISQWVGEFPGYERYDDRTPADLKFREYVVGRLLWYEKRLKEVARGAVSCAGAQPFAPVLFSICAQLQDSIDLLRTIPYAFGEFMTAPFLPVEQADEFYIRDEEVLRCLTAIQSLIDPTLTESTDMGMLVKDLLGGADQITQAIQARQLAIAEFIPRRQPHSGGL